MPQTAQVSTELQRQADLLRRQWLPVALQDPLKRLPEVVVLRFEPAPRSQHLRAGPISGLVKRFSHADVIVDVGSPYRVELASRMKVGLRRRHGWFPACLSEVHAARPR